MSSRWSDPGVAASSRSRLCTTKRRNPPSAIRTACCDGVWEMIYDKGIEDILLQEDNPQRVADKIVEWSNNAGGEDNISVIIVAVERP